VLDAASIELDRRRLGRADLERQARAHEDTTALGVLRGWPVIGSIANSSSLVLRRVQVIAFGLKPS
jgi:hypothetical protein